MTLCPIEWNVEECLPMPINWGLQSMQSCLHSLLFLHHLQLVGLPFFHYLASTFPSTWPQLFPLNCSHSSSFGVAPSLRHLYPLAKVRWCFFVCYPLMCWCIALLQLWSNILGDLWFVTLSKPRHWFELATSLVCPSHVTGLSKPRHWFDSATSLVWSIEFVNTSLN